VFLGTDHSFGDGPPLLWETMIFGGKHDEFQERYSNLADAKAGHKRALQNGDDRIELTMPRPLPVIIADNCRGFIETAERRHTSTDPRYAAYEFDVRAQIAINGVKRGIKAGMPLADLLGAFEELAGAGDVVQVENAIRKAKELCGEVFPQKPVAAACISGMLF
jgi:hypothetical protein